MAFVGGVSVPVVYVVDVALVGDGDVPAALAMDVVVSSVLAVAVDDALVDVIVVDGVYVTVVGVVGVVAMGKRDVPAALAMDVDVVAMLDMGGGHGCSSSECRMASLTMWPTWSSTSR